MIKNTRTVTREDDDGYLWLFAEYVHGSDGDEVKIQRPSNGRKYRMPGSRWNDRIDQQRAEYHGTLVLLWISADDPELKEIP